MYLKKQVCPKIRENRAIVSILYFICGLTFVFIISGCNNSVVNKQTAGTSSRSDLDPKTIQLQQKIMDKPESFPYRYYYYPQVAEVFDGSMNGELVGLLWKSAIVKSSETPELLQALYLIDPARKTATKVVEPRSGFQVSKAALSNSWIAWVERNDVNWKIYILSRTSKVVKVVDQGAYFKEAGPDYPSVTLYEEVLVYNTSVKNAT